MNRYYITEKNEKQFNAANKAREDIEEYFKQNRYKPYTIYSNIINSKNSRMASLKELISGMITLKYRDCLYIQYPYYIQGNKINFLIKFLKKFKKLNLICIIHDIDSLRYKDNKKLKQEVKFFNMCKVVISHNEKMTEWLKNNGCTSKIINLEIFDYLLKNKSITNARNTDIVFAGNLDKNKSKFIYKLIENENLKFTMNLYGPNFEREIKNNNNIKYCGKYSPEDLVENIEGRFGLIWDGDELDFCSGYTGEYTKYNNPHKLSLYVVSELPVVCWNQMAISKFIRENNIGIAINSLEELNNIDITKEEYNLMVRNIIKIKQKIKNGEFIKTALKSADDYINN